ncbi:MAG: transglutaminase family protein [Treponema sp.]|nr:transglutaminase family protein [Treponema sp.]
MKLLSVDYSMSLQFSGDVSDHYFTLRCVPISRGCQTVLSRSLEISPEVPIFNSRDVFGNIVYRGHCFSNHKSFSFRANAEVQVHGENGTRENCPAFYKYHTPLTSCTDSMRHFLYDAFSHTEFLPMISEQKIPSERVRDFMRALLPEVYSRIEYKSGSTTVRTSAAEAFEGRKGVCQDYAHLMIALCRHAGIAARYVCGMSIGEGATHAWVEFFVPDDTYLPKNGQEASGTWYGIDPTRNKFTDDAYVILAVGRDFCDCQVDRGVFCGAADQKQTVFVKTTELPMNADTSLFSGHSVRSGADMAGQQQSV